MRLLQVLVPNDNRNEALRVLVDRNRPHTADRETRGAVRQRPRRGRQYLPRGDADQGAERDAGSAHLLRDDAFERDRGDGGTITVETRVTIAVRRPADAPDSELATTLERALEEKTDHDAVVVLEFIEEAAANG